MSELLWIANPLAVVRHFHQYRYLLFRLAWREVQVRYRGSWLGPLWSLMTPLLMLGVYTFVFSVVFQSRWTGAGLADDRAGFALALFGSLTAFGVFGETVGSSPGLILAHQNYVKRVVFPLEILPVARLLANLVQAGFSFSIYLAAVFMFHGGLPATVLFLPLVILPLALIALGCSLFLSALGVFIRDVNQVVGLLVTMLMFMSAVFYPVSSLPPDWRPVLCANPLVVILEDVRRVTLQGLMPNWPTWVATMLLGVLLTATGLLWFMKSKNAFADVL